MCLDNIHNIFLSVLIWAKKIPSVFCNEIYTRPKQRDEKMFVFMFDRVKQCQGIRMESIEHMTTYHNMALIFSIIFFFLSDSKFNQDIISLASSESSMLLASNNLQMATLLKNHWTCNIHELLLHDILSCCQWNHVNFFS